MNKRCSQVDLKIETCIALHWAGQRKGNNNQYRAHINKVIKKNYDLQYCNPKRLHGSGENTTRVHSYSRLFAPSNSDALLSTDYR